MTTTTDKCSKCGSLFLKNKVNEGTGRRMCYMCYSKNKLENARALCFCADVFNKYLIIDENKQKYFQCDVCSYTCELFVDVFSHHYKVAHKRTELLSVVKELETSCVKFLAKDLRGYQCNRCDFQCSLSKDTLMRHFAEEHEDVRKQPAKKSDLPDGVTLCNLKFKCTACGKDYTTLPRAKRHIRRAHGEKNHRCEVCGKSFCSSSELRQHGRRHESRKKYFCDGCGEAFSTKNKLRKHFSAATDGPCKLLIPPLTTTNELTSRKARMRKKMSSGGFPERGLVEVTDDDAAVIAVEEAAEIPEKEYVCGFCHDEFFEMETLKQHVFSCHSSRGNTAPVEWTNEEKFLLYDKYLGLLVSVGENDTFFCTVCGKQLSRIRYLKSHLRVHLGEKPYTCSFCGKAYSFKSSLESHMLTEMNLRRYSCSACGKRYNSSSHLTAHTKKHHRLREFKCTVCCKEFAYNSNLNEHMRTHSTEKPYFCDKCGGFFRSGRYLKEHLNRCTLYANGGGGGGGGTSNS